MATNPSRYPAEAAGTLINASGDTTGATDTTSIQNALNGGEQVNLNEGTFYITSITLPSFAVLQGSGFGTVINATAGSTTQMISLAHAASTVQTQIRNLTLVPNETSLKGIALDNTGYASDARHIIDSVIINQAGGDGLTLSNMTEARVNNVFCYNGQGNGFTLSCTDSRFTNCTAGSNAGHGYSITGNNNGFVNCKAYWSGYNGSTWGTTECGFEISGVSYCHFASCEAQQNALHGFDLETCTYCAVTGCDSDTNSAGASVTTGVGINLNAASNCSIVGNSGANNGSLTPGAQKYGVQVTGTQTNSWFALNTTNGSGGTFNYVSGSGYILIDSTVTDFSGLPSFKVPESITTNSGAKISQGSGAPSKPMSDNPTAGDIYFRTDTPSTADQRMYICTVGGGTPTWVGVV